MRAAWAAVDDAAVAEATARGQRVERLPERQREEARALPSPQPGHLAVLAVDPREVLRRELDHVRRQGELLDRVVELPHPDGGRLPRSAPAARELERPGLAEQVDGKVAGAVERLEAPGPELAPLDALARPAHEGPRPDRGRRLRPGTGHGRAEGDRGGESRERPSPPLAQRAPAMRLTSRRSATRTTTRTMSRAAMPACDWRNSTAGSHHRAQDEDRGEDAPPRRDVAPAVGPEDDGEEEGRPGGAPGGRGPARAAQAFEHRVASGSDLADRHPADREVAAVGQVGRDQRRQQHQDADHREQNPARVLLIRTSMAPSSAGQRGNGSMLTRSARWCQESQRQEPVAHAAVLDHEATHGDRQAESPRPGAAGVEPEDALPPLGERLVRVAEDHDRARPSSRGVEPERAPGRGGSAPRRPRGRASGAPAADAPSRRPRCRARR